MSNNRSDSNNNTTNELKSDLPSAILSIDIGTTNLKTSLYDQRLKVLNSNCLKLNVLQPREGYFELNPEHLFESIKESVQKTINDYKDTFKIECLGISTQRNSFLLFNKETDETYCNFILWNDMRPMQTCNELNHGFSLNTLKFGSGIVNCFITNQRMKAFAKYRVETNHITAKLIDQLKLLEEDLEQTELQDVLYGTIETWIIWKLTKEKTFATEISCACCTGFYDIFRNSWSGILTYVFSIPKNILPEVYETCQNFGHVKNDIANFGNDVPITSVIGDAQSSLIAECGFNKGDCVLVIGTGSFISVNIGDKPISATVKGLYPLCAFKHFDRQIYIIHCAVTSAGVAIDWAKSIGLFDSYDDIEDILRSCENSNGVYFVPAFGSLEVNGLDKTSLATGFIGLKANSTKSQMLRAVFDAIAYATVIKMEMIIKDLQLNRIALRSLRISGGVSKSNFLCQYLADLLQFPIERSNFSYSSSTDGAAFLAGLGSNLFNKLEDLQELRHVTDKFIPNPEFISQFNFEHELAQWKNALQRFVSWHK